MAAPKPRHYIIVVHGIGEQKQNETATEVIHRFAEVRQHKSPRYYQNLLPAYLSAQSVRRGGIGHGWSEFNGIPVDPTHETGNFDGSPATNTSGRNFRFVDLHWAHILQIHQRRYASPAEKWSRALLGRLRTSTPEGWIEPWATHLLHALVNTALPVKKLVSFYRPQIAKLIYDDFLGDVHLYGDYARTRGRAARHFHVILDEIHLRDFIDWCHRDEDQGQENPYQPPEYTIIAHSLGSVMSFDALIYSHAIRNVRKAKASADHPCPSLPFPGYTFDRKEEKETWTYLMTELKKTKRDQQLKQMYPQLDDVRPDDIPFLLFRDHVRNFVTLGSPIDKYHVLWYQNYLHMGLKKKEGDTSERVREEFNWWERVHQEPDAWLEASRQKMVHYNLCDEQDPVGHHLDLAQETENYRKVFETGIPFAYRDVVFRRYGVPGLAHVKYWEDQDLFLGIIKELIQEGKQLSEEDLELTPYEKQQGLKGGYFLTRKFRDLDGSVYRKALLWAYFRIPFAAALVTGLLLSYGLLEWAYFGFAAYYPAALLAALLLWTCPKPTQKYLEEALPEERKNTSFRQRWKFRRSIFAHLVAGTVEWRRVLIMLSEGGSVDRSRCLKDGLRMTFRTAGGFRKNAWWRFAIAIMLLVISAIPAARGLRGPIRIGGDILLILSASYLGTMLYVLRVFLQAKK